MRNTARPSSNARWAPRATRSLLGATLALLCACGGGGDDTKGAAGTGPLPNVGQPCTKECMTGFVCENTGPFAGQCTAGCNSGAACQLLYPGTGCFGPGTMQCGLICTAGGPCPEGTTCTPTDGQMACRIPGRI